MSRLKARVRRDEGAFIKAFMGVEEPIAKAATAAITEAGNGIKQQARAQIGAAGFSRRWQNALRVDVYPRGRTTSINAAAHIYHKIHYAWVFEEGATVRGSPFLWLPLRHAPQKIGRMRATPRRYTNLIGPLQFVRRAGKPPLLVAKLGMSRNAKPKKVSANALKRGYTGRSRNRVVRSIPIFIGISSVRIEKRFHITRIINKAAARLGDLYFRHLKVD